MVREVQKFKGDFSERYVSVSGYVLSRIDDCNVVLAWLPAVAIPPLQRVMYCNVVLAELSAVIIPPLQRFVYSNVVLTDLPAVSIPPSQHAMHAAAHLVTGLGPRGHVTRELHWLPVVKP